MDKIRLTEQDLHMLVEDAVRQYFINEEIDEMSWAGLKGGVQNAWNGAFGTNANGQRNFNFNVGQTFRSGRDASAFNSYVGQAEQAIKGMIGIANNTKNQKLSQDLQAIIDNLNNVSGELKTQADNIAAGNRKNLGKVNNPWQQQRTQQDNQYAEMLNNQQADYQNQLQGWQDKYNKLNTRYKNYKAKNPANNGARTRKIDARSAVEAADKSTEKARRKANVPSEIMQLKQKR